MKIMKMKFRSFFINKVPKFVKPGIYSTLFFTGHGPFLNFLFKIGVKSSNLCSCGEEESASHFLMHSQQFQNLRQNLFPNISHPTTFILNKNNYTKFETFCFQELINL